MAKAACAKVILNGFLLEAMGKLAVRIDRLEKLIDLGFAKDSDLEAVSKVDPAVTKALELACEGYDEVLDKISDRQSTGLIR